jgi:signal transduction histidine kinase
VDLAEVARSTLLLTERELSGRARLERSLEPAPVVRAPRQKLHQVALNLVVNAMHAVEARPLPPGERHTISLRTRTVGDHAVLEVSDTGVGITEANLKRVFEPFFTTKPVGVGTGLGLSVCALVAERAGGTIEVTSQLGAGTTFTMKLPLVGAPEPELPEDLP